MRRGGKTLVMLEHIDQALNSGQEVVIMERSRGIGKSVPLQLLLSKKSTRMWMKMMRTGNWDRRKMKRMWRLVEEGR
jgi:alpha-D-ribose 1-methylphosphonate 5-triphosphate synthase subunit PhnL